MELPEVVKAAYENTFQEGFTAKLRAQRIFLGERWETSKDTTESLLLLDDEVFTHLSKKQTTHLKQHLRDQKTLINTLMKLYITSVNDLEISLHG